jgi:hypothetical protein
LRHETIGGIDVSLFEAHARIAAADGMPARLEGVELLSGAGERQGTVRLFQPFADSRGVLGCQTFDDVDSD